MTLNQHLAWHYVYARQYDEAIAQCERTAELTPNYFWLSFFRALALEQKGMLDEAVTEFEKAVKLSGGVSFAVAGLGHAYAIRGNEREARDKIDELLESSKKSFIRPFDLAVIHCGLRENDQAFDWLEKAFTQRSSWLVYLGVEPRLDPIRDDPRFHELMSRVGLVQARSVP